MVTAKIPSKVARKTYKPVRVPVRVTAITPSLQEVIGPEPQAATDIDISSVQYSKIYSIALTRWYSIVEQSMASYAHIQNSRCDKSPSNTHKDGC